MILFGLTGGVAMGKSTAADVLRRQGVAVVDTDDLAREVVEPGQTALAEIGRLFGPSVIDQEGRLDRNQMAQLVFADPGARRQLEKILHPRIRERWLTQAAAWRKAGRSVGVVVIPLLFETDATPEFDVTVCVACTAATQRKRLSERGWSPEQCAARVRAQWPVEKKMNLSDVVVWTEGGVDLLEEQLHRVLRGGAGRSGPALGGVKGP